MEVWWPLVWVPAKEVQRKRLHRHKEELYRKGGLREERSMKESRFTQPCLMHDLLIRREWK